VKRFIKDNYPLEEELPTESRAEKAKKKASFQDDFLTEYASIVSGDDDVDRYFSLLSVAFIHNLKETSIQWILRWWSVHKHEYRRMAVVARDYLGIPGAEVDVERLFNIGREILGLRRYSMTGETMRALILLRDYLRREQEGQV
jgi:hypothetical protein